MIWFLICPECSLVSWKDSVRLRVGHDRGGSHTYRLYDFMKFVALENLTIRASRLLFLLEVSSAATNQNSSQHLPRSRLPAHILPETQDCHHIVLLRLSPAWERSLYATRGLIVETQVAHVSSFFSCGERWNRCVFALKTIVYYVWSSVHMCLATPEGFEPEADPIFLFTCVCRPPFQW